MVKPIGDRSSSITYLVDSPFAVPAAEELLRRLREQSMPYPIGGEEVAPQIQEEYLNGLIDLLSKVNSSLRVYGWDGGVMDNDRYLASIQQLSQQEGVRVMMVIPENDAPSLEEKLKNATIKRVPGIIERGFIIFDDSSLSYWDKTRQSAHPDEKGSAIYRVHFTPREENLKGYTSFFDRKLL